MTPPPLKFTISDSDRANTEWGANCGPHALAAILGKTLDEVRPSLGEFPGYTNPTRLGAALRHFGVPYELVKGMKSNTLCQGINRVQWEGPWLNPGVPVAAAYYQTHWVAQCGGQVLCTVVCSFRWIPVKWWAEHLAGAEKKWHITHHYRLTL